MMPEPADHSVAALRWFADQLPQISGLAAKTALSTGLSIRTVLNHVTLGDNLDVRGIDPDDLLDQFDAATVDAYTVNTRATYRTGFHRGMEMFLRWQDQDPNWDHLPRRAGRRADGNRVIIRTFPVRTGVIARFALPVDLTDGEADRLIAFLRSVVVAPDPPTGSDSGR